VKLKVLSILLLILGMGLSSCRSTATVTPSLEPATVQDQASLVKVLQEAGATVETGDSITQEFFSPEGHTVKVNGAELQVFEYKNAPAMEKEASQVAPDGGSVGTSMMNWIDTPHFYKAGRIIVLYVGSDQPVLGLLNKVVGPQFAGG